MPPSIKGGWVHIMSLIFLELTEELIVALQGSFIALYI